MIQATLTPAVIGPAEAALREMQLKAETFETIASAFVSFQQVHHNTPATYLRSLRQFNAWVNASGRALASLNKSDILAFINDMRAGHYSPNTINSYVTAVRRFYVWLEEMGLARNIAANIRSEKYDELHVKKDFTASQAVAILKAAENNKRDFAILNLMLYCGLRVSEISNATIGDIQLIGDSYFIQVLGKGDKVRRVPIPAEAMAAINDYKQAERKGAKDAEPLFASKAHQCKGGKMATASISRMAKDAIRSIGIDDKKHTAHSLRHTTAGIMYEAGVPLPRIQKVLGHSNIATTEIYAKDAMERDYLASTPNECIADALKAAAAI